MISEKKLDYTDILKFWAPLAMMWVVMSLEMPVINAVVARMSFPKENLAIFGVVFSISLIIEGPIIQMLSAATALSSNYSSYKKLSRFLFFSVFFLTSIHLLCAAPHVFNFIAKNLLNLQDDFIHPARISFLIMFPWTSAIGYRRMWQGVLIRDGRTYAVTAIMIFRILVTISVLFAGFFLTEMRGSYIAALSLSAGVTAGALAAGLLASSTIRKRKAEENAGSNNSCVTWSYLFIFYAPLALTSFVTMANRPIISAGITRGLFPVESLAAWPVVLSFVFLFQSIPLSFQEAAIALISDNNRKTLKRSITVIGAASAAVFLAAVITPFGRKIFLSLLSGLPDYLIDISLLPLLLMTLVSFAAPAIAWLRAVNIRKGTTANIAWAVAVNLTFVSLTLAVINLFFSISGIMAAALSYTTAVCAEALFLTVMTGKKIISDSPQA